MQVPYNLFLDDFRHPVDAEKYTHNKVYSSLEWIVVKNYKEFVDYIRANGVPSIISFDHDLAEEHYRGDFGTDAKTGYDCAVWLDQYCSETGKPLPNTIYVHSMNPVGGQNIKRVFE